MAVAKKSAKASTKPRRKASAAEAAQANSVATFMVVLFTALSVVFAYVAYINFGF